MQYPMLRFIERHGGWLSIVLGALIPLAAVAAFAIGASVWWMAPGIVIGAIAFVALQSYVELVRLMIDMLLPK